MVMKNNQLLTETSAMSVDCSIEDKENTNNDTAMSIALIDTSAMSVDVSMVSIDEAGDINASAMSIDKNTSATSSDY